MKPASIPIEALPEAVRGAERRIEELVRQTEVERSSILEGDREGRIFFKLENLQHTGSFKLRGAANRLLSMSEGERARGVVAASSGNHGKALAYAAAAVDCPAVVYVPEDASPSKIAAIRKLGTEVRLVADDCVVAEAEARTFAESSGRTYVSPYNDPLVIAGQGTLGVELSRQVDSLDALFVAVGGGGLISGVGAFLKSVWPGVQIVACSPTHSAVLHASLEAGRILEMESLPTLSDGTAGGLEAGSITFELCRQIVDESILVSEAQIRHAMRLVMAHHHFVIEGAAAVAVAAFLEVREQYEGQDVGIVVCGGNVDKAVLEEVLG